MTSLWVTGPHPVEELLASRTQRPRKVLLAESVPGRTREKIRALADAARVPCLSCPREEWSRRTGEREGGGVAAELAAYRYAPLGEWLGSLPAAASAFLLDGVTDPQNLGAIVRNARAFGVSGVVTPTDRSCPVTASVFRASAGAAAHVPVIQVTNLARTIEELKEAGFWIYAAVEEGETDLLAWEPAARTGIVLGSEETGIRRLVRERCDGSVRIGMAPGVDSINVATASGILAFFLRKALTSSGK